MSQHFLRSPADREFVAVGEVDRVPLDREPVSATPRRPSPERTPMGPRRGAFLDPPDVPIGHAVVAAAVLFTLLAAAACVAIGLTIGVAKVWTGGWF